MKGWRLEVGDAKMKKLAGVCGKVRKRHNRGEKTKDTVQYNSIAIYRVMA